MLAEHQDTMARALFGLQVELAEVQAVTELVELTKTANDDRMAGFYADFDSPTSTWTTPAAVTEAEFEKTYGLAEASQATTKKQVSNFK